MFYVLYLTKISISKAITVNFINVEVMFLIITLILLIVENKFMISGCTKLSTDEL